MDILQEYLLCLDDTSIIKFSNTCKYLTSSVAYVQSIEIYWKRRLGKLVGADLNYRKLNDTWRNMYTNLCKNQINTEDSINLIVNAGLHGYDEITDIMLETVVNLPRIGIKLNTELFQVRDAKYSRKVTRVYLDYIHLYPGCAIIRILEQLLLLGNLVNPELSYVLGLLNIAATANDVEFMKHLVANNDVFSSQLTRMLFIHYNHTDFLDSIVHNQSTEVLEYLLQFPGLHGDLIIRLGGLSSASGNVNYVRMILLDIKIPRHIKDRIIELLYLDIAI